MNPQIKPVNGTGEPPVETLKATKKLKRSLLLAFGTLVPCAAAIGYSVLQLEQSGGTEIKKISLLFSALSLPVYLIVLLLKASITTRRERREITAMVNELTTDITTHGETAREQRPAPGQTTEGAHASKTDALVRKIVQMINA